ncbi:lycopene cyclase family protein [Streptomyces virginiae]|uniref:lycopene cyclase family protein n=1 Tax=Streptomyces virginiae TaxID=1961 RepID=UPI0035DB9CB0
MGGLGCRCGRDRGGSSRAEPGGGSCPDLPRQRAAPTVIVVEAPPGPLRSPARTWCYREANSGSYDSLLSGSWDRLRVYGPDGASLAPSEQPSARLGNPRLLRVRSSWAGCEQAAIGVAPSRSTEWRSSSSAAEWRAPDICTPTPAGLNGQFERFRVEAGCERARAQP